MVVKRSSPTAESWTVSPAKQQNTDASPRKQYSQRNRSSIGEPVKIGQSTPAKQDASQESPSKRGRGRPRKSPVTPPSQRKRKADDADSSIGSESGFADSIHDSPSQTSPKKAKYTKSATPQKLAEQIYLENLKYEKLLYSESREERLAKRRSRQDETPSSESTPVHQEA